MRYLLVLAILASRPVLAEVHMGDTTSRPAASQPSWLQTGEFRWRVGEPVVAPASRPADPCYSIKDPSIVQHQGRWHLFCTIRSQKRTHQIEYLPFADFPQAHKAPRHVLKITDAYFCAPQVFYFTPHKKWYLLYQAADQPRGKPYGPAISTTADVADPATWSEPVWLDVRKSDAAKAWLDFWIICDEARAHLFFTSLDGKMWRAETKLTDFPAGWSEPQVALTGDIFEASHTYLLKGLGKYLTIVEAQGERGRRYYKAYLADQLDGEWKPLAATADKPFASWANVKDTGSHWTDSVSHAELLRAGCDERLEVDPARLRLLFQGVTDEARAGLAYGQIPWRLGILEPAP